MSEQSPEHFDETDVPSALERTTFDGPGTDVPPPSDFAGFATEGVEEEPEGSEGTVNGDAK